MTTSLEKLMAKLGIDTTEYTDGLDKAESRSDKFNATLSGIGTVGGIALAAGTAAAAAGVAAYGAILAKAVGEASEAENAEATLNAVLQSTKSVSGETIDTLLDRAAALQKVTAFSDDAINSGQSMLLTFTQIKSPVFADATKATMNLAEKFGSMETAATMVGKALNDPLAGVTALRKVGVQLTDEQEASIKMFMAQGDIESAQRVILGELETEFGGLAEAMGKTTEGQRAILKNKFNDLLEKLGTKILPVLNRGMGIISNLLDDPRVSASIDRIGTATAAFGMQVLDKIPLVIDWVQKFVNFFQTNQPIVIGVLTALGVAIGIWAVQTAIAGWTAMAPFLPIIAILLAIAAVVALFVWTWQSNFLGIRDTMTGFWTSLQPVFQAIKTWFEVNIPIAIQFLSNAWNNVLLPALTAVWNFLSTYIFPLFVSIGNFIGAVFKVEFQILAGIFTNFVIPAFQSFWNILSTYVFPVIQKIADWVVNKVTPAFQGLKAIITMVTSWFNKLSTVIGELELPSWLTPGSPTPLEMGLRGITTALKHLNLTDLPDLAANLDLKVNGVPNLDGDIFGGAAGAANSGNFINYGSVAVTAPKNSSMSDLLNVLGPA